MNIDDALLISYVDGQLSTQQRSKVEAAIAQSAELSARVAVLSASCLPYRAAFDSQMNVPLPETLARSIDELVSASMRNGHAKRQRAAPQWQWLAVAFFVGATSAGTLFHFASDDPPHRPALAPWVQAASDYQDLYVRETIAPVKEEPTLTTRVLADIQHDDGIPIRIPDLSAEGLRFKRIQRLSFHRAALIQMVYLPDRGEPVALCAMKEPGNDQGLRTQQVGDMQVVTWRRSNLTYSLLGKEGDLRHIAERIAEQKAPALYGDQPVNGTVPQA